MKNLILIIIFLCAANPCYAKWKKVIENNFFTEYFETNSVKKINRIIYVWSMRDYKKPMIDGNLSLKYYGKYDCAEMKYQFISIVGYKTNMGKGRIFKYLKNINNDELDPNWKSSNLDKNDILRLNFVCKK